MKRLFPILLVACFIWVSSAAAFPAEQPVSMRHDAAPGELRVLFVNVGKADAALLQYDDKAFLIDTGAKVSAPALMGALNLFGVDKLDGVFLTHADSDHAGGLDALATNFPVETLYSSVFSENKKNGKNKIEGLARDLSLSQIELEANDKVPFSEGVCFQVLGPLVFDDRDGNDNSLVLKVTFFGRTLLFMGDAQFAGEEKLLQSGADLRADVLKAGNHGNPDAISEAFAAAVSPRYTVISTDTKVDEDSANERVLAALRHSDILLTQDFAVGVLVTILNDGAILIGDPPKPRIPSGAAITGVDLNTQTVTVRNDDADEDISGFMILSQRGNEVFMFPEGTVMQSGQSVTVSTEPGADHLWQGEAKVWHQEKQDSALLYDRFGNLLSKWN